MRFFDLVTLAVALLQREGRVTYRGLQREFGVDDALLEDLRAELILARGVAADEGGRVLVWTGEPGSSLPRGLVAALGTLPPIAARTPSSEEAAAPAADRSVDPGPAGRGREQGLDQSGGASPRSAAEAERRQLTVMFCDLVGSTDLSGRLDPEDLREVVRAYQEMAAVVVRRLDGSIAQYLGDGMLVYFGYPQAHEDDARRAVQAGLDIVDDLAALNQRLDAQRGVRLAVRVGIHTGPVVVGAVGCGDRHEQLALGETPNIAARIQGLAEPDTVMASAATARLTRGAFVLEDRGPASLRGVAEPVEVVRIVGSVDARAVDGDDATVSRTPLVGRDEEVGLLLRRWEQSKERLGQVVLVAGEAGIGKSRLVETIREQALRDGLPRLTYRCSPYHTNSALYPVIGHLQRALLLRDGDSPGVKLDKIEAGLRDYRLPMEEVVPLFAALLSVPLDGRYPEPTLSPQQLKQQTMDALVAWLMELADRQPALAVWEDLHWADPTTLELAGLVIDQSPTAPILNVLTYRPDFQPPWPMRSHITPLTLNRLERPQVEAMITALAGGKPLPGEVVRHIVAKTDGVPLFVEELARALIESSLLREEPDRYVLAGSLAGVAIPATLQDSLMARLDRLPTVREVAQLGAVLGREFAYEMLRIVAGMDEPALRDGLAQLVGAELLYQRGRPPRARYTFKHALIQDAAYASLLRSTRQRVHQEIAGLLESRFPDTATAEPELIAHHYTEAGCPAPALEYWRQAGQRAIQRSANVEAVAHLRRGLELLPTLPDTPERARTELALQTTLGPALMATRGYGAPEVARAYERARDLCEQVGEPGELFPVLWGLWLLNLGRGRHAESRRFGEECLALARRIGDSGLLMEAHVALCVTLFLLGEFALARSHGEEGVALYDPAQHRGLAFRYGNFDAGVAGRAYLGYTLWALGHPDQAVKNDGDARALVQTLNHPYTHSRHFNWSGILHQLRRDAPTVLERSEAAVPLAAKHGLALVLAVAPIMRGWALAMQGRGAEGLALIRQGLEAYRATGAEFQRPHFVALLAEVHGTLGQAAEGLAALGEARAAMEESGERYYEAEIYRLEGEVLLAQEPPAEDTAEACFRGALETARRQQARSLELRAATSLARLWQRRGKPEEARQALAEIYASFTEGFKAPDLEAARSVLASLQ
jgi:class 3 adenylate cyclase/predicted ATPase